MLIYIKKNDSNDFVIWDYRFGRKHSNLETSYTGSLTLYSQTFTKIIHGYETMFDKNVKSNKKLFKETDAGIHYSCMQLTRDLEERK